MTGHIALFDNIYPFVFSDVRDGYITLILTKEQWQELKNTNKFVFESKEFICDFSHIIGVLTAGNIIWFTNCRIKLSTILDGWSVMCFYSDCFYSERSCNYPQDMLNNLNNINITGVSLRGENIEKFIGSQEKDRCTSVFDITLDEQNLKGEIGYSTEKVENNESKLDTHIITNKILFVRLFGDYNWVSYFKILFILKRALNLCVVSELDIIGDIKFNSNFGSFKVITQPCSFSMKPFDCITLFDIGLEKFIKLFELLSKRVDEDTLNLSFLSCIHTRTNYILSRTSFSLYFAKIMQIFEAEYVHFMLENKCSTLEHLKYSKKKLEDLELKNKLSDSFTLLSMVLEKVYDKEELDKLINKCKNYRNSLSHGRVYEFVLTEDVYFFYVDVIRIIYYFYFYFLDKDKLKRIFETSIRPITYMIDNDSVLYIDNFSNSDYDACLKILCEKC